MIGYPEGPRRILAFRRLLHRHTIASNWRELRLQLPTDPDFIETLWRRIQIDDLKKRFGISEDPLLVQDTPRLSILGWNPGKRFLSERHDIRSTLEAVFGEHEGKKRRILNSYLLQQSYPVEWWTTALTKESGLFGLDILQF
ncbi:hypothetical protein PGT21_036976 [Puccinia graminis f. sp. tritici]|uniref:Uncharacterized protein n=2 Tax=Puccinia graminis f. sp. tritici TaxID=56615 RepID=H6QUF2_PUCGT|nr:uncharacterized protein PGTG_22428 [Puccinia graminis f. sp. tritici CRL 75-36-700-3]EHS64621.1 hypothetical protein PGTG_22428 [Puccinia graminis f. sp. tritici CRL 75-36-700-3]KAA1115529.1 hypothetical protein PGT21_036976 [Puccinia graminis f. sp. tritici]